MHDKNERKLTPEYFIFLTYSRSLNSKSMVTYM